MTCNDISDLANLLTIEPNKLSFIIYQLPDKSKYHNFKIPKKSGGFRSISAPNKTIKSLQRKLSKILELQYKPYYCSHGFERDRNIVTNAKRHLNRNLVLNIDLSNFFDSITFQRVFGLLRADPYNFGKSAAGAAANLICHNKALPQGGPSSPIITNMICRRLDARLTRLCNKSKARYSRYVDDITISTNAEEFDPGIVTIERSGEIVLGSRLKKAIASEWFAINENKTRLQSKSQHQGVTGLTVNKFPNLSRSYINNVFAMIHDWRINGITASSNRYTEKFQSVQKKLSGADLFRSVVIGRISHIASVRGWHDQVVWKLCRRYCQADKSPPRIIGAIGNMDAKDGVFIGHASEEKESIALPIYRALREAKIPAFIDVARITWGTSISKTIDQALKEAKIFLAIISVNSKSKAWPEREIHSAISRELSGGKMKVLPLFVGTPSEVAELREQMPLLASISHKIWDGETEGLVEEIKQILSK